MPGFDGLDLVRGYRDRDATRHTPLIVLSSRDEAAIEPRPGEYGTNDYLVKLPDPVELVARIRSPSARTTRSSRARAYVKAEKERLVAGRQADMLAAPATP